MFAGKSVIDLIAQSVRLGWSPSYPTFTKSSLALADEAEAAAWPPRIMRCAATEVGELKFAVEDPEAEETIRAC